jgi:hypothetical protein
VIVLDGHWRSARATGVKGRYLVLGFFNMVVLLLRIAQRMAQTKGAFSVAKSGRQAATMDSGPGNRCAVAASTVGGKTGPWISPHNGMNAAPCNTGGRNGSTGGGEFICARGAAADPTQTASERGTAVGSVAGTWA